MNSLCFCDVAIERRILEIDGNQKSSRRGFFLFENYERMADFRRNCKGSVMVRISDHPDSYATPAGIAMGVAKFNAIMYTEPRPGSVSPA